MKRYSLLSLALLIVLMFSAVVVMAQQSVDDEGNVNDPRSNERANACYDGGTMAGKCDSDWEWNCGWYLIRFEYGVLSRANFPTVCASLLPAEAQAPQQPPVATGTPYVLPTVGCIFALGAPTSAVNGYVDFGGGNFLLSPPYYLATDCSGGSVGTVAVPLAYAPNGIADAISICILNGYTTANTLPAGFNPVLYQCN